MWWRILIPTWRFFDAVGVHPELFVRIQGEWQPVITRPRLRWYSLFFNPGYNRFHACNNLLERLILELAGDVKSIERLVSYKLVENLAREFARARAHDSLFEFKVTIQGQDVLLGSLKAAVAA